MVALYFLCKVFMLYIYIYMSNMYIASNKYGKPNLGKNVQIIGGANFGSEPYLITIGDDTTVSFDCAFVTHDAATRVIRNLPDGKKETVIYAPINVGKNCFIGCRTVVLPGVTIGDNCIIGAGSIVNRDIPSNTFHQTGSSSTSAVSQDRCRRAVNQYRY